MVRQLLVAAIVAHSLSPIDSIPDFIPLVGYLDDLLLIPLGIALAIRLVPPTVRAECGERARQALLDGKPISRAAAAVIVVIRAVRVAWCIVWTRE